MMHFFYSRIFHMLPRPLRILLNLCLFPFFFLANMPRILRSSSHPADGLTEEHLNELLHLPVDPQADSLTASHLAYRVGAELAEDGAWIALADRIEAADAAREKTPMGRATAVLMAGGAVSRVTGAAEEGDMDAAYAALAGITHAQAAHPDRPALAAALALAHLNVAWAIRGHDYVDFTETAAMDAFVEGCETASGLLDDFNPVEYDSPLLATLRCELHSGLESNADAVVDDHTDLIELDPASPAAFGSLGRFLLPRWMGTPERLELEARRAASLTADVWGLGGYYLTLRTALRFDAGLLPCIDMDMLGAAMIDYLDRQPDQGTVNRTCAFCANLADSGRAYEELQDAAAELDKMLATIARRYLRVLHPVEWCVHLYNPCHAPDQDVLEDMDAAGHEYGTWSIAAAFREDLFAGRHVTFGPDGVTVSDPVETLEATPQGA